MKFLVLVYSFFEGKAEILWSLQCLCCWHMLMKTLMRPITNDSLQLHLMFLFYSYMIWLEKNICNDHVSFRVSQTPDCKMPPNNLARVFGPTMVGHSCPEPEPAQLISETKYQALVRHCSYLNKLNCIVWMVLLSSKYLHTFRKVYYFNNKTKLQF